MCNCVSNGLEDIKDKIAITYKGNSVALAATIKIGVHIGSPE